MKTINIILTVILLVTVSCNDDILDVDPTTFITEEMTWDSEGIILQNLANVYGTTLCAFNRKGDLGDIPAFSHIDLATDDGNGKNDAQIQLFNTGGITQSNTPYAIEIWRENYRLIRKANTFIEGIDLVESNILSVEKQKRFKAEVRFLRAFSYFQLVKTFGGVPLITRKQKVSDEDVFIPRNSIDEIYNFILEECNQVTEELPTDEITGHVSKGAALALKAKALLYYASPLNNPQNQSSRWSDAAAAAKVIMDMKKYSLFPDYRELFLAEYEGNNEVIFDRQFRFPESVHIINMMWGFDTGAWGGFSPTQDIVDAYEMKNGLPISDPESGYDPNNPYVNRDNRLAATIVYNGSTWRNRIVEFFIEGNAYGNKEVNCGYGLKKFNEEAARDADFYNGSYAQHNNWIYFRYAEVLLNYAEAQNEANGPDNSVYDAINQVRTRAGQPDLPTGLSKDDMRQRIWNERRVELVYEEHRFYDVRRWGKGMEIFNKPIHETVITKNQDGSLTYEYREKESRTYKSHFDFLPIPIGEIEKNIKLVQNPGY